MSVVLTDEALRWVHERRNVHELACLRNGACPDCGGDEFEVAQAKSATVMARCVRCGQHFLVTR